MTVIVQQTPIPVNNRSGGGRRRRVDRFGLLRVLPCCGDEHAHVATLVLPLEAVTALAAAHHERASGSAVEIDILKLLRQPVIADLTKESLQGLVGLDHDVSEV